MPKPELLPENFSQKAPKEKGDGAQPIMREATEKGLFHARDGTQIYYECRGTGRPLVLCYGLTCRIEHWRHQIAHFSQNYRVIALDYRGHQRSAYPENDRNLTISWCASDVEDLILHLEIEDVVCFGHSLGVPVVAYVANRIAERVSGLVFVCGAIEKPFKHMFYSNKFDAVFNMASALYGVAPGLVDSAWQRLTEQNWLNYFFTSRLGFNPRTSRQQDISNYMKGVHESPFSLFHSLLNDYRKVEGQALLKKIQCPTLVIAGEADFITPVYLQQEMVRLIALGQLVEIAHGSHNAHTDYPKQVNAEIDSFLKELKYQ